MDLPWLLKWLPNTHGIDALIRNVSDLPYVRFTTLKAYLRNHQVVGTFHFSQDAMKLKQRIKELEKELAKSAEKKLNTK